MLDFWKSGSFEMTIKAAVSVCKTIAKYATKYADYAMTRIQTVGFAIIKLHGFEIR